MSLADAIREVAEKPPPPLTIADHPVALHALGECLDRLELGPLGFKQKQEREELEAKHQRQREKAKPAA